MEGSQSTVNTTKGIRLASWEPEAVRESRYPKTPQGCSNITAALPFDLPNVVTVPTKRGRSGLGELQNSSNTGFSWTGRLAAISFLIPYLFGELDLRNGRR
jgi:hypothetical protein